MNIKVGDIVDYGGEIVRLMAILPHKLLLNKFGLVNDRVSKLQLIESTKLLELSHGDFVIIHDIPQEDKRKYPFYWGQRCEEYVASGQPYKVIACCYDDEYGEIACVNGGWFYTYHLEKIDDYDIV